MDEKLKTFLFFWYPHCTKEAGISEKCEKIRQQMMKINIFAIEDRKPLQ